jgi:tripartite-type tricarboxylate transporter receptor subunit TctC
LQEDEGMSRRLITVTLLASVLLPALAIMPATAVAESYPSRAITLIVPYPAGGGADLVGRLVGQRLSTVLGQPVVLANRGGAGGILGSRDIARAAPDGYTFGIMLTGASLSPNTGYDINKDFTPIGIIASTPVIIVAHPSFPQKTLAEVIALAKKEPGKLTIGSPPPPILNYFAARMFNLKAGVDTNIVTYRGTALLTNDLLGNQVPLAFNTVPGVVSHVQAGALRAIAVAGKKRSAALPDVPTATESGLPDFDAEMYYGLAAPAGLPRPIVDRLNKELRAILMDDEFRQKLINAGNDPAPSTPEEYASNIKREEEKWVDLIKKLEIKIE